MSERKYVCPVCGANLKYVRIDDDKTVIEIKSDTTMCVEDEISISMDGKGRALDNIIVERFWRSLKYEEVYLKEYETLTECRSNISDYIEKYNNFRPHSTVGKLTPDMAYFAA